MPAAFDAPLAPHHKLLGRWAAAHNSTAAQFSRIEARAFIEKTFDGAVMAALDGITIADLRVIVLHGMDVGLDPAIAIVCDSVGQLDLGWIEKSNVLSNTLFTTVAPVGWRAAAYRVLAETLNAALPIFGYDELVEELAAYYWDGETDDDGARRALVEYHGADPTDLGEMTLPSQLAARRPDWMLAENAAPLKNLPVGLANRIRRVRDAREAVKVHGEGSAWHFAFDQIIEYLPGFEDCAHLPPMTLVPFDEFARELDDVGNHGMQQGFMDIAGLCALKDGATVEAWFTSLKLGAELLRAAQDLIDFDPAKS